jgi:hypothetical protein
VQAGYTDSWRWRMEGGEDGPVAHRAWWSGLVTAVARAPAVRPAACESRACPDGARADPAPYAALVATLGPASAPAARAAARGPAPAGRLSGWLVFLSIVTLLVAEWASRRARGAR